MHLSTVALLLSSFLSKTFAATYSLSNNVVGSQLYSFFLFETGADPTHGRVNYVDKATAIANNLSYTSDHSFVLRADHKTVLPASGPGRNSVRIRSVTNYTTHVVVFDVRHMPQGCATWPATWETEGSNWPNGGEVDIIEGVNDQGPNSITLHTGSGCTMPSSRHQTGTTKSTDCDSTQNHNTGCGVAAPDANSYGHSFNSNGGGWYAMERTDVFIRVWFWPRNGSPPNDVLSGAESINTNEWGTPTGDFPNTSCNIGSKFGPNNIIINLTLCGDWAGPAYSSSGCPGSCVDYVNNNPSAFSRAYWEFASIRVYQ